LQFVFYLSFFLTYFLTFCHSFSWLFLSFSPLDTPEDPSLLTQITRRVRSGSGSLKSGSNVAPRKQSLEKDRAAVQATSSSSNVTNVTTSMPMTMSNEIKMSPRIPINPDLKYV
jgi:hypothetical protein